MNGGKDYEARAKTAERMAAEALSPHMRESYQRVAQSWRTLARQTHLIGIMPEPPKGTGEDGP